MSNKINTIYPVYTMKLEFITLKTNVETLKIDIFCIKILEMIIVGLLF